MSKVKIQGNASGTGVLTVTAPNTSTDSTITLPDATATIATTTEVALKAPIASPEFTGNVGIGKTSPSQKLEVQTTGSTNSFIAVSNTGTGEAGILFDASNGDIAGSDYGWIKQKNDLDMEIGTADQSSGDLIFNLNGAERARILSAVGGGITFNGDTAAANALDDYEEGTWTPSLNASTYRNGTWSSAFGVYTKIGNIVHLYFGISGSGMYFNSELGYQAITGVPFTAANPTGLSNYSGSWSGDDVVRSSAGHVYLHTNNIYMHAANSNPSTTGVNGIGGYISYRTTA